MRLAYVRLDIPWKLPGKDARSEFTEEQAPGMRYDSATHSLVIGDQGLTWGHVVDWRRLNLELVCPMCEADFKNEQGRAQHMKTCKGRAALEKDLIDRGIMTSRKTEGGK